MGQGLRKQSHTILSEAQYDRWTEEGYHFGTNKEVFDAELYAIYRAVRRFGKRREHDQEYTMFVDSQAAIKKVFDRPPTPRAGGCEGYYPVEREHRESGQQGRA